MSFSSLRQPSCLPARTTFYFFTSITPFLMMASRMLSIVSSTLALVLALVSLKLIWVRPVYFMVIGEEFSCLGLDLAVVFKV